MTMPDDPESWVNLSPLPDSRACVDLGQDSGIWEPAPAAEMAVYVAMVAQDVWRRVFGRKRS